jgi:hypothetical protein
MPGKVFGTCPFIAIGDTDGVVGIPVGVTGGAGNAILGIAFIFGGVFAGFGRFAIVLSFGAAAADLPLGAIFLLAIKFSFF